MFRRDLRVVGAILALLALVYIYVIRQPSNERDWEYGMATLAGITIDGSVVHVQNVRDYGWSADGPVSSDYVSRAYDTEHIVRMWFVEEPFTIGPLLGFEGVAHTYFMFDFDNGPPVGISVEARRERNETFDAFRGLINDFELIYIWGTERDLTGSRAVREKNQLYMYPLTVPKEYAQRLFLYLAEMTQKLETEPRFYNTLTSNCTNELAKVANMVKPGAIPPNIASIFPGYSDEVLYDMSFFPRDTPLDDLRRKSFISEFVKANYQRDDFSAALRQYLATP